MNDAPDKDRPRPDAEAARSKLMGRAMLVGFVLLVAVYALFTFLGRR